RQRRVNEERAERVRQFLDMNYNYRTDGTSLGGAALDLLVDLLHLAEKDRLSSAVQDVALLAFDLYKAERPWTVDPALERQEQEEAAEAAKGFRYPELPSDPVSDL